MFLLLLVYVYVATTLLLLFVQDKLNIFKAAVDTYVYVMFGALSVDTTFSEKYAVIVVVTGSSGV